MSATLPFTQESEQAAAAWTGEWFGIGQLRGGLAKFSQQGPDIQTVFAGGRSEVTVMADACEAFRQDMQQPPADELADEKRLRSLRQMEGGAPCTPALWPTRSRPSPAGLREAAATRQHFGGDDAFVWIERGGTRFRLPRVVSDTTTTARFRYGRVK
jgi:hypothetical protein